MALPERFAEFRRLIDAHLNRVVPAENMAPEPIYRSIRYSLFPGGKRFRPVLCLAAAESLGLHPEQLLPVAAGIEMVHTYSLIHDDLPCMDDDDYRRGRPSNHKVFGEAIAVLAGDALLTGALAQIAAAPYEPSTIRRLILLLTDAAGTSGMVGGQVMDIMNQAQNLSHAELENLHRLKTASLIRYSAVAPAIVLKAGEDVEHAFSEYGNCLGLAFQIIDDILDVEGTTAILGKTAGKDQERSKATYASILGIPESKRLAQELIQRACNSIRPYDSLSYLQVLAQQVLEREK
jgi:geranylgeranyl diphosphate synthase type II